MRLLAVLLSAGLLSAAPVDPARSDNFTGHPRLIVISDIGNEPDDQMSLIRLLLYSNEIDIEGLIASTSTWQKAAVHPETMRALIQAYGQVRPNLLARQWLARGRGSGPPRLHRPTRIRIGRHRRG